MKLGRWTLASLAMLTGGLVTLLAFVENGHLPRASAQAQSNANDRVPTLDEYQPKSTLVTAEHKPDHAKYPFVDIHSHHWNPAPEYVDNLVKEMDTINLRVMVNLSGGTGESLKKT